jgi:hypothetical protein
MMRTLIFLGGLLGLTLSAPSQIHVQARLGHNVAVGASIGLQCGPVVCTPPVVHRAPAGEWREITERVWVEGTCRQVCHPAVWGWGYDHCGRRVWSIVRPEWTETVHGPGHYEYRTRRVFVPCAPVRHGGGPHRRW